MKKYKTFTEICRFWQNARLMADDLGVKQCAAEKWSSRDFIPCEYWVRLNKKTGVSFDNLARLADKRRVR